MKRLPPYVPLCLICLVYISCQNVYTNKKSPEDITRISSDELIYEVKTQENLTTSKLPKSNKPKKKKASKLNNSTHQEMLVVYTHLDMSWDQILLFEDQFNKEVKKTDEKYRTQIEIQDIMNASFQTVLSEKQFSMYNEWRNE